MGKSLKRCLAIDVGDQNIRICHLTKSPSSPMLKMNTFLSKDLVVDSLMDDEDKQVLRLKRLKELLKDADSWDRSVVCSVPGQSVFTRIRNLPPVPKRKIPQIVKYEIQQQVPFSLDQLIFSYYILEHKPNGGYKVLMAAIKEDVLSKHLAIFKQANCNVHLAIPSPIANYNWLKYNEQLADDDKTVALIDLGSHLTEIVVGKDGHFSFTRPLNIGGNDITQALCLDLHRGYTDAEKAKRLGNILVPENTATLRAFERMISEISRTFAYYRALPDCGAVERVILTGGGSKLAGFTDYLQKKLGLLVTIADPLAGIECSQEMNIPPARRRGFLFSRLSPA